MSNYPTEDLLAWFGTKLGAIGEAAGDSFTPQTVARRGRPEDGDEGTQRLPAIIYHLQNPGGTRHDSRIDERLTVVVTVTVSGRARHPSGEDESREAPVNRARADVLAAIFENFDEEITYAQLEAWSAVFFTEADGDEADEGVEISFECLLKRARENWRQQITV